MLMAIEQDDGAMYRAILAQSSLGRKNFVVGATVATPSLVTF